jgi:hypothetical protein
VVVAAALLHRARQRKKRWSVRVVCAWRSRNLRGLPPLLQPLVVARVLVRVVAARHLACRRELGTVGADLLRRR